MYPCSNELTHSHEYAHTKTKNKTKRYEKKIIALTQIDAMTWSCVKILQQRVFVLLIMSHLEGKVSLFNISGANHVTNTFVVGSA